ncbi:hypothetical protein [Desulfobacter curvatus]|uniref:hypothetical protein n=1 Tax=Desulfobacter curvatus TaxID=2290 RepID=UPI0012FBD0BE|nr:hypothetical protein [Desulfobacter curvatus]
MNQEQAKLEILKLYFDNLRHEIIEKIKLSHQLGYYKLISLGLLVGICSTKKPAEEYEVIILLAVAILPLAFDLSLFFNGNAIVRVGDYIRDCIEPQLKTLIKDSDSLILWEEYISPAEQRASISERLWWNLFESVQPLISIVAQIGCFYILNTKQKYAVSYFVLAIIVATIFLLMNSIIRKSKK